MTVLVVWRSSAGFLALATAAIVGLESGCSGKTFQAAPAEGGASGGGSASGSSGSAGSAAGKGGSAPAGGGAAGTGSTTPEAGASGNGASTGGANTGGAAGAGASGAGGTGVGGFTGGYSFTVPGEGLNDQLRGIAVDSRGRAIAVGTADSKITLGEETHLGGILILRLDAAGNLEWGGVFGSPYFDNYGAGVAVAADDSFVVAGAYRTTVTFGSDTLEVTDSVRGPDAFVVKFDAEGNALWARGYGSGPYDVASDVALDASGNVYVTGWVNGTVDFGGGPRAASAQSPFVLKLDPQGNHVYSHVYPCEGAYSSGSSIGVDASGKAYFSGYLKGAVDFGGGTLSRSGDDIAAFLVALDAQGNHGFSGAWGAAGFHYGVTLVTEPNGGLLLAGTAVGTIDFGDGPHGEPYPGNVQGALFAARFAPGPVLDWSATATGSDDYDGYASTVDAAGNYYVAGEVTLSGNLYGTPVLVTFDPQGNETDQRMFAGDGAFRGLAVDAANDLYAAGYFFTSVDFGFGLHTGENDIFVVKLARD